MLMMIYFVLAEVNRFDPLRWVLIRFEIIGALDQFYDGTMEHVIIF